MTTPSKKKPRVHFSLALRPDQIADIRTIQGWAESDPQLITTQRMGLQTAVLYAVQWTLRNPPRHVGGRG